MRKLKKIEAGIIFGAIFGIVDIIPMLIIKMTWDTLLSAFVMCVIGGFLIATSNLKLSHTLKGIVIFFLIAVPMIIVVGASAPKEMIPMIFTNLVIGSLLGYFIGRFGKN